MVCVTGEAKLLIIELVDARHKLDLSRPHSHSYDNVKYYIELSKARHRFDLLAKKLKTASLKFNIYSCCFDITISPFRDGNGVGAIHY